MLPEKEVVRAAVERAVLGGVAAWSWIAVLPDGKEIAFRTTAIGNVDICVSVDDETLAALPDGAEAEMSYRFRIKVV